MNNSSYPAIILLLLSAYAVGKHIVKDGEPKSSNGFFGQSLFEVFNFGLLYWGGFWDSLRWPQITWIFLFGMGIAVHLNKKEEEKYSAFGAVLGHGILWFIYVKGGLQIGW